MKDAPKAMSYSEYRQREFEKAVAELRHKVGKLCEASVANARLIEKLERSVNTMEEGIVLKALADAGQPLLFDALETASVASGNFQNAPDRFRQTVDRLFIRGVLEKNQNNQYLPHAPACPNGVGGENPWRPSPQHRRRT